MLIVKVKERRQFDVAVRIKVAIHVKSVVVGKKNDLEKVNIHSFQEVDNSFCCAAF